MRHAALLTLLISAAAFAQEKPNTFFVFVSDPQYVWTKSSGSDFNAGYGVAIQHMFTPRWSGEVAASHRSSRALAILDFNGTVVETLRYRVGTTPVDLIAQYHFVNTTAWKPYIGGGYSHLFVSSPKVSQPDANFAVFNAGVVWLVRPTFGIRFDGKVYGGNRPAYVDNGNISVGVAWRW